jgi:manganese-dependent ADP-ribose/CDP-alcohol diphosphatase
MDKKPIVSFGMVADVQYASDVDDLEQYGRMRYYKNSLNLLKSAITDWKNFENTKNEVKFLLDLGDIADSFKGNKYIEDLNKVLDEMETLFRPESIFHVWGNHEVAGSKRRSLIQNPRLATAKRLKQTSNYDLHNYFWYDITDRLRLVCLDLYEISPLGYEPDDQVFKDTTKFIEYNQKLLDTSQDEQEKNYLSRFKVHGGAASQTQLQWLEMQLIECKKLGKKILLAGHTAIKVEAADKFVAWNADDILKLIWSFNGVVCAYFCGHAHVGKYYLDEFNVHHLTVSAILETKPNTHNSYVTAQVYQDRLVVKNQNKIHSFTAFF